MKKPKPDKRHTKETRDSISQMLKEEKTRGEIGAHFGFNKKVLKDIIDRWELEELLLIPRLVGVR